MTRLNTTSDSALGSLLSVFRVFVETDLCSGVFLPDDIQHLLALIYLCDLDLERLVTVLKQEHKEYHIKVGSAAAHLGTDLFHSDICMNDIRITDI